MNVTEIEGLYWSCIRSVYTVASPFNTAFFLLFLYRLARVALISNTWKNWSVSRCSPNWKRKKEKNHGSREKLLGSTILGWGYEQIHDKRDRLHHEQWSSNDREVRWYISTKSQLGRMKDAKSRLQAFNAIIGLANSKPKKSSFGIFCISTNEEVRPEGFHYGMLRLWASTLLSPALGSENADPFS